MGLPVVISPQSRHPSASWLPCREAVTDPRELPIYTVADAAHYARVPRKTLSDWLTTSGGVIEPAKRKPLTLSFWNFIEAWVLSSIRSHKVPMQRVRKALAFVQRELQVERPLISVAFKTDGIDLFVEDFGGLVNASAGGKQLHMREVLEHYTQRISYHQGSAAQLYPFVRTHGAEQPRAIVIDPSYGFGRPVITGTGVRTDVVFSRYQAGESHSALAEDYNVSLGQIEDAIRAEAREAA